MRTRDEIECWLTDMDGVLVHENQALPGAAELLQQWTDSGTPLKVSVGLLILPPRTILMFLPSRLPARPVFCLPLENTSISECTHHSIVCSSECSIFISLMCIVSHGRECKLESVVDLGVVNLEFEAISANSCDEQLMAGCIVAK